MKIQAWTAVFLVMFFGMAIGQCHAENSTASDVVISEVPADAEPSQAGHQSTGYERPEGVSAYGAIKPIQLPIEYSGKAFDAAVSGVGRVISFPFTVLSKKLNTKNAGGNQNAEEKNKKES